MKKVMKGMQGIVLLLVLSALLSHSNAATNETAQASAGGIQVADLRRILPEFNNDILADAKVFEENGKKWMFYLAKKDGTFVGTAFASQSPNGYGGPIKVLVAISPDSTIRSVEVLQADKESQGLGSRVKEPKFKDQFKGRKATNSPWAAVTEDGGEIHAVTGATISSRAVVEAVKAGLDVYVKHADEITKPR